MNVCRFLFHRAGGHCNHIFAFLYLLSHWCLLGKKEIPADKTCTSLLATNLAETRLNPYPLWAVVLHKLAPDPDDKRRAPPVTWKLYDAQSKLQKVEGWNRLRNQPELLKFLILHNPLRPLKLFQSLLNSLSNADWRDLSLQFLPNRTPMHKFQLLISEYYSRVYEVLQSKVCGENFQETRKDLLGSRFILLIQTCKPTEEKYQE